MLLLLPLACTPSGGDPKDTAAPGDSGPVDSDVPVDTVPAGATAPADITLEITTVQTVIRAKWTTEAETVGFVRFGEVCL